VLCYNGQDAKGIITRKMRAIVLVFIVVAGLHFILIILY